MATATKPVPRLRLTKEEKQRIGWMIDRKVRVVATAIRAAVERKKAMLREEVEKEFAGRKEALESKKLEKARQYNEMKAEMEKKLAVVDVAYNAAKKEEEAFDSVVRAEVEKRATKILGSAHEIEARIEEQANKVREELWGITPEVRELLDRIPSVADLAGEGLKHILPSKELSLLIEEQKEAQERADRIDG